MIRPAGAKDLAALAALARQNHDARRLYERYGFTVIGAHSLVTASGIAQDRDLIMVRRQSGFTR